MKKLNFVFALLLCIAFYGCNSTPVIDGKNPFVVEQIDDLSDGMCKYYGSSKIDREKGSLIFTRPVITLPRGIYNIGDTISWKK